MTVVIKMPDFWDWIEEKMSRSEFGSLSIREKKEVFLRYKWGMTNNESNSALESSERDTIYTLKGFSDKDWKEMGEERGKFFKAKLRWWDYCSSIDKEIFGAKEKVKELNIKYNTKKW